MKSLALVLSFFIYIIPVDLFAQSGTEVRFDGEGYTSDISQQRNLNTRERFIYALSELRDFIIESERKKADRYRRIKAIISRSGLPPTERSNLIHDLINDSERVYHYGFKNRIRKRPNELGYQHIDSVLNIRDSIKTGDFLKHDLVFYKLIEEDYPYKPDQLEKWILEISSYDLKDSMNISDVGAGHGFLSILISLMYENAEIKATEIDSNTVQGLLSIFKVFKGEKKYNLSVIYDTNQASELSNGKYDRIIARLSFHHFEKKRNMLKSFSKSLSNDGYVLITEVLKGDKTEKIFCNKLLRASKIRRVLRKADFEVADEIKNGEYTIFKCKPRVH